MLARLLPTVATACLLYGGYTLYSLFLTPLFSPSSIERPDSVRPMAPGGVRRNAEQARTHLADEPWAADAGYQVRREAAYLYAGDWEKVEPSGAVRFTPFAMIWHQKDDESGQPITVSCKSALLQFEKPFDERDPRPGRIVGGALEGKVTVRGADGLKIHTENVQFAEGAQRLWSDAPLSFAYGPHSGKALGLELDLIPGPPEGDKPGISGVRTIRLRKNVAMTLVQPPEAGKPGETVFVRSGGMFEYHVAERQAVFQHKVRVEHPVPGAKTMDTLDGELLTLFFEPRPGTNLAEQKPGTLDSELELRRLRAEGAPAVIVSQRSEVIAKAAIVTYDVVERTAKLTHPTAVDVTQKESRFRSPEITLTHTEDGQIVRAHAPGAGTLDSKNSRPGAKAGAFHAAWKTDLTVEPDPEAVWHGQPLRRITLRGEALAHQPGQMLLKGDVLQIWISDEELPGATPAESGVIVRTALSPHRGRAAAPERDVRPHRMLATGTVHFESPELSGNTKRLEAHFEEGHLPLTRPREVGKVESGTWKVESRKQLQLSTFHSPLSRPGFAFVESERVPKRKPKTPREPAHIVAEEIRLRMIRDGEETDVAEVWNNGRVRVTQARPAGEEPFELVGQHLHLTKYSDTDQVIDLLGEPALIRDRGFEIEGADLHLDRGRNYAEVNGAGRLRLPIRNSPDGKPLKVPMPLDVRWKERMTFNGQTADFIARVVATMDEHKMTCELMRVTLVRPIRLASESFEDQQPELHTIRCEEAVSVRSRELLAGAPVSVRIAQVREFTLDQVTGETLAKGPPGKLLIWNFSTGKRGRPGASAGVQANKPQQAEKAGWDFTQIDFAGTMTGNVRRQTTTFQDRVEVVHGPVEQAGHSIDADNLPRDGSWMGCDKLTFTQHKATQTQDAWVEAMAQGNARLEGHPSRTAELEQFNALADFISFDESKGLYLIRSSGTRGATIWRQIRPGLEASPTIAQRMEFIPAKNQLKVDRATVIDVGVGSTSTSKP